MGFWALNYRKILMMAAISFGITFVAMLAAAWSGDGFTAHAFAISIPVAALVMAIAAIVLSFRGMVYYFITDSLFSDTTERSFLPVFSDGYTSKLSNEERRFTFTTQKLRGVIDGFPVDVYLLPKSKAGWPTLIFSFYPLVHAGIGGAAKKNIGFRVNLAGRLKKDVKPEVLDFVKEMRSEGYTVQG